MVSSKPKETIDFYLLNCYTMLNGRKCLVREYPVADQMNN